MVMELLALAAAEGGAHPSTAAAGHAEPLPAVPNAVNTTGDGHGGVGGAALATRPPKCRRVVKCDRSTGAALQTYSTGADAASAVGGGPSTIYKAADGRRPSAFGFKWRRAAAAEPPPTARAPPPPPTPLLPAGVALFFTASPEHQHVLGLLRCNTLAELGALVAPHMRPELTAGKGVAMRGARSWHDPPPDGNCLFSCLVIEFVAVLCGSTAGVCAGVIHAAACAATHLRWLVLQGVMTEGGSWERLCMQHARDTSTEAAVAAFAAAYRDGLWLELWPGEFELGLVVHAVNRAAAPHTFRAKVIKHTTGAGGRAAGWVSMLIVPDGPETFAHTAVLKCSGGQLDNRLLHYSLWDWGYMAARN